jgi:hypothetical protein
MIPARNREQQMSLEHSPGREKRQRRARHDVAIVAYDIKRFCDANCISRSLLYRLWREGRGPRFFLAGTEKRITIEAAAEWRAAMQAATDCARAGEAA